MCFVAVKALPLWTVNGIMSRAGRQVPPRMCYIVSFVVFVSFVALALRSALASWHFVKILALGIWMQDLPHGILLKYLTDGILLKKPFLLVFAILAQVMAHSNSGLRHSRPSNGTPLNFWSSPLSPK